MEEHKDYMDLEEFQDAMETLDEILEEEFPEQLEDPWIIE